MPRELSNGNIAITISLTPEALEALDNMRPRGARTHGRFLSELLIKEWQRREVKRRREKLVKTA